MELGYKLKVKYFVIDTLTNETLATTDKLEIANLIKANYKGEVEISSTVTAIPKIG